MASISTQRGDDGSTGLIGGARVSKSNLRVEACGTIDELNSAIGFARSLCDVGEVCDLVKGIQRELFIVGTSLATLLPAKAVRPGDRVTTAMVEALTTHVRRIETVEGMLSDWSIPGEHTVSAAFDMARTICRRAERHIVHLIVSGETVDPNILPYINRLSDLLWLIGRWLELRAGIDGSLRAVPHR
jgi:cob(I)alamin adenosyltransferase